MEHSNAEKTDVKCKNCQEPLCLMSDIARDYYSCPKCFKTFRTGRYEVKKNGTLFAIVVTRNIKTDSIEFLTPVEYPIQIGLLQHKGGKFVPLHFHNNFHYKVDTTHEILYVEEGEIEVSVTDFDWNEVEKVTLQKGEMIMLLDGGHSVDLKDGSRVWEIKQGPYPGDTVAKVFKDNWEGSIPQERCKHTNN